MSLYLYYTSHTEEKPNKKLKMKIYRKDECILLSNFVYLVLIVQFVRSSYQSVSGSLQTFLKSGALPL